MSNAIEEVRRADAVTAFDNNNDGVAVHCRAYIGLDVKIDVLTNMLTIWYNQQTTAEAGEVLQRTNPRTV